MDKLRTSNAKNKSARYGWDCHLDNWVLGSQHIHQLCIRTDFNEYHITSLCTQTKSRLWQARTS